MMIFQKIFFYKQFFGSVFPHDIIIMFMNMRKLMKNVLFFICCCRTEVNRKRRLTIQFVLFTLLSLIMKFYIKVGEAWLAVPCGDKTAKISSLVEDALKRSQEAGAELPGKVRAGMQ